MENGLELQILPFVCCPECALIPRRQPLHLCDCPHSNLCFFFRLGLDFVASATVTAPLQVGVGAAIVVGVEVSFCFVGCPFCFVGCPLGRLRYFHMLGSGLAARASFYFLLRRQLAEMTSFLVFLFFVVTLLVRPCLGLETFFFFRGGEDDSFGGDISGFLSLATEGFKLALGAAVEVPTIS